jgi:hypothetical protein
MRPDVVVMAAPGFDHDPRLRATAEPLDRKTFVAEFAIEAFICPVLPGFARIDERSLNAFACKPLQNSVPASSPLSPIDLLHCLDLKIPLRHEFFELRVFDFQGAQPFDIGWLQFPKSLAPSVYRLLAQLVLLRDLGDRTAIGFPQNRDHLFFGETALLHRLPFWLREPFSQLTTGPENVGRSRKCGLDGSLYFSICRYELSRDKHSGHNRMVFERVVLRAGD